MRHVCPSVRTSLAAAMLCLAGNSLAEPPAPAAPARIFLSLRVLSEQIAAAGPSGRIPDECLNLGGIGSVEGYVLDATAPAKDVILYGAPADGVPSLRLDDLIVNMRTVSRPGDYPLCSLDPREEDILALNKLFASQSDSSTPAMRKFFRKLEKTVGPQMVVVEGVPRTSRHAHIMIDADYHMKKVSQGSVTLDGVTSYLDLALKQSQERVLAGDNSVASGTGMARFWFHIGEGSPTFRQADGVVALERCDMVVLTHPQGTTETGATVDVNREDPHALAFAGQLSKFLTDPAAPKVPVYEELENLFRLRALLLGMEANGALRAAGWKFASYAPGYRYRDERPMEPTRPGLANYREWKHVDVQETAEGTLTRTHTVFPMVCGGVGMDMEVTKSQFATAGAEDLRAMKAAALAARPSPTSLTWKMPR